jgi:hypothetical protein
VLYSQVRLTRVFHTLGATHPPDCNTNHAGLQWHDTAYYSMNSHAVVSRTLLLSACIYALIHDL